MFSSFPLRSFSSSHPSIFTYPLFLSTGLSSLFCFDSLSVSTPLADERAEGFSSPPEQTMKMKVWSVCWCCYRGNTSPVCLPSTPNEQLLTRKHLFKTPTSSHAHKHTHKVRNKHKQNYNRERHTDGCNQKAHSSLCSWQGVGGSLILIMQQVSISEPRCHLLLACLRDAGGGSGSYMVRELWFVDYCTYRSEVTVRQTIASATEVDITTNI